jgi:membrane carboxypeptidase/penicillin-binding protein PbpC
MKTLASGLALALLLLTNTVSAANAPVNIAHPVSGSVVTNYFHSSFTTTCPGGSYKVEWYLDNNLLGNSAFYDSEAVDFDFKAPTGWHVLTVVSSCGKDSVRFYVQ